MSATEKKISATLAALDWVGMYEADDPEADIHSGVYSITLQEAFRRYGKASLVKRKAPDFPEDMVEAYAMLQRMYNAQVRTSGRTTS